MKTCSCPSLGAPCIYIYHEIRSSEAGSIPRASLDRVLGDGGGGGVLLLLLGTSVCGRRTPIPNQRCV